MPVKVTLKTVKFIDSQEIVLNMNSLCPPHDPRATHEYE